MSKRRKKASTRSKTKLRFWGKLLLWTNIIIAISLLIAWLCSYADPADFWPAAFIAMAFPVLIIANLFFILLWLIRLRIHFLISLIPILLGWNLLGAYFSLGMHQQHDAKFGDIQIASLNVRTFNKNDYYVNKDSRALQKTLDWVYAQDPDIMFFQEFYTNASRGFNTIDSCRRELNLPHIHKAYYKPSWKTMFMATFSKLPVIESGVLSDENERGYALWTDVEVKGDTLRMINAHLQSIRLATEMSILDSKLEPGLYKDPEFRKEAKSLIRKMKKAFIGRSQQTKLLCDFIQASPYPVVLAGDLNDTPASYTYRKLRKELQDAFSTSGKGTANTYAGGFPSLRIDYIMSDNDLTTYGYKVHKLQASDHFPLSAGINISK